jgi:hypothetical protein
MSKGIFLHLVIHFPLTSFSSQSLQSTLELSQADELRLICSSMPSFICKEVLLAEYLVGNQRLERRKINGFR